MRPDHFSSRFSPWFSNEFPYIIAGKSSRVIKIEKNGMVLVGIEKKRRLGFRILQVGSHFGTGLSESAVDLLDVLDTTSKKGFDAAFLLSPFKLDELNSFQIENSTGTIVLDLTPEEKSLWKNIRRRFKGYINQGTKKGNSIRWNCPGDLADIAQVYKRHVAAKGYDGVDWSDIVKLAHSRQEDFTLDLCLVRDPDGTPAAMASILLCGNAAIYFVGASNPQSLSYYPGHFLHWNAILRYKEMGFNYYDFGGATRSQDKSTYKITTFKAGFGGQFIEFYTYEIPLNFKYKTYKTMLNVAKDIVRRVRP